MSHLRRLKALEVARGTYKAPHPPKAVIAARIMKIVDHMKSHLDELERDSDSLDFLTRLERYRANRRTCQ